jgi:hypothetical protein
MKKSNVVVLARVRSMSDGRVWYSVSKRGNAMQCSCKSFIFRRVACKHIKAFRSGSLPKNDVRKPR